MTDREKSQIKGIKWYGFHYVETFRNKSSPSQNKNAISVAFDKEALFVKMSIFFRVGHPTLRLPYSDIQYKNEEKERLGWSGISIRLHSEPDIEMVFYGKHRALLLEALAGSEPS